MSTKPSAPKPKRAADILVEALCEHGVDRLFLVPGESYLAVLDSLYEETRIDVVTCRHEGGAGFMAVADAKLTKKPGVVFVSRGPGATNVSIAAHLAEQDGVPLVIFVGQVAEHERGRRSFQEVDYTAMFGHIAKSVFEVSNPDKLSETISRAFCDAQTPTRGPVIISVMEDMLCAETDIPNFPVLKPPVSGVDMRHVQQVREAIEQAERPLIIAGGGFDALEARPALKAFADAYQIPVATTFKHQQIFDNRSDLFAGHLGFKIPPAHLACLQKHDLLIALGTRLGDTPTQNYQLPRLPNPDAPIIHITDDARVIGRVFPTHLGVVSHPADFCDALAKYAPTMPEGRASWVKEIKDFMQNFRSYTPKTPGDGMDFSYVVDALSAQLGEAVILTMDSGNFSSWVHLLWPFSGREQVLAAIGGAMGLGLPAGIAAALRAPEKPVISFVGDGGIMMTGNELGIAVARQAPVKLVIANNRSFGTIRLHQEKAYPERVSSTALLNPDFTAWARSFGAWAETLDRPENASDTVTRFLAQKGPAVLNVLTSTELVSAFITVEHQKDALFVK